LWSRSLEPQPPKQWKHKGQPLNTTTDREARASTPEVGRPMKKVTREPARATARSEAWAIPPLAGHPLHTFDRDGPSVVVAWSASSFSSSSPLPSEVSRLTTLRRARPLRRLAGRRQKNNRVLGVQCSDATSSSVPCRRASGPGSMLRWALGPQPPMVEGAPSEGCLGDKLEAHGSMAPPWAPSTRKTGNGTTAASFPIRASTSLARSTEPGLALRSSGREVAWVSQPSSHITCGTHASRHALCGKLG
jgi:hypothetical protein